MPIYVTKDEVLTIHFGFGDIGGVDFDSRKRGFVDSQALYEILPGEIGRQEYEVHDFQKPDIVIVFENVESLDTVILRFQELRDRMASGIKEQSDGSSVLKGEKDSH